MRATLFRGKQEARMKLPRHRREAPAVARKITGLQRVLDAPALFSLAYGEVASSIYVALGIIALHALGLTPEVLALVGALFVVYLIVIALSALFMPHYLGAALKWGSLEHNPWDVVVGASVIMGIAAI